MYLKNFCCPRHYRFSHKLLYPFPPIHQASSLPDHIIKNYDNKKIRKSTEQVHKLRLNSNAQYPFQEYACFNHMLLNVMFPRTYMVANSKNKTTTEFLVRHRSQLLSLKANLNDCEVERRSGLSYVLYMCLINKDRRVWPLRAFRK